MPLYPPATGGGADWNLQIVIQKFDASGTYTPTANMVYCIIECIGGGGGGGGAAGTTGQIYAGGGGGAGSYARSVKTAAAIGASKAVTIGAAGSGGAAGANAGTAGGDTSVTTLAIGKGGSGGAGGSSGGGITAGAGGVAGTGDFTPGGEPGENGIYSTVSTNVQFMGIARGGNSLHGGCGNTLMAQNAAVTGGSAVNYGSGGAGGVAHNTASTAAGGNGSAGSVIITEYLKIAA